MIEIEVKDGPCNPRTINKTNFKLNSLHIDYKKVKMREINL